ncbi:suppressor of fused domain protein, partial [Idiomarina abyssalis]|uniref:suppressor of fused domain protein n=1 Tax=Idiomarina abyssalis TaxID=86102 RepID=UPI003A910D11
MKMATVTSYHKQVARHAAFAFGVGKPPVTRYLDDNKQNGVFILEAKDSPQAGVNSYSTVGLSDHPLILNGKEFGVRVEIAGACGAAFSGFENVIATSAFCIINSKWFCAPGRIFPDIISMYGLSKTMSDIYFANPFLWDEKLASTSFDGQKVAWLLAVPVSKAESEFAQVNGPDKLESLFYERDIDIYNLNR